MSTSNTGLYSIQSYYEFHQAGLPIFAEQYISPYTNLSTFIAVGYDSANDKEGVNFCKRLQDDVNYLVDKYNLDEYCSTSLTGYAYFEIDTLEGVKEDSAVMDKYIGPIAFLILAIVIQNAPVMIIPLFVIVSSLLMQFLVMYLIAVRNFGVRWYEIYTYCY